MDVTSRMLSKHKLKRQMQSPNKKPAWIREVADAYLAGFWDSRQVAQVGAIAAAEGHRVFGDLKEA